MAASAASTALPPARRVSAPACAVRGCPAATTPRTAGVISEPWDELGHVDVGGRPPRALGLLVARDPRLARGLGPRVVALDAARRPAAVVARRDDRDPDLVLEVLV